MRERIFLFLTFCEIIAKGNLALVSTGKMATASKSSPGASCAATDLDRSTTCRSIYDAGLTPFPGSRIFLDLQTAYTIYKIIVWPIDALDKFLAEGIVIYGSNTKDQQPGMQLCNMGDVKVVTNVECRVDNKTLRTVTIYKFYDPPKDLLISELEVYAKDEFSSVSNPDITSSTTNARSIPADPPTTSSPDNPNYILTSAAKSSPNIASPSLQSTRDSPLIDSVVDGSVLKVSILAAFLATALIVVLVLTTAIVCLVRKHKNQRVPLTRPQLPSFGGDTMRLPNENSSNDLRISKNATVSSASSGSYLEATKYVNFPVGTDNKVDLIS